MRGRRLAVGLVLALTFAGASGALYKWVDENGRVQYSDRPPGKNKASEELSNRGIVVKKIEGGLTPEQRKAKEEQDARKKSEEAKAAEQQRQDSVLLQSFTTPQEIDMRRDREVEALKASILALREQQKTVTERLGDDRRRAATFDKNQKPVPDVVRQDIARGEVGTKALSDEIARKTDAIAEVLTKYENLKKRYIELSRESATQARPPASVQAVPLKK